MCKDYEERVVKFESGAVREDKHGKGRCDLLPMCALIRLSKYYEKCLERHEERNWEKGIPMHSFLDSAIRHLFKYMDGWTDEDHLCAAAWNILGAMWTEEKRPKMQDIPSHLTPPHLTEASPLASGCGGSTPVPPYNSTQEKANPEASGTCSCWNNTGPIPRCNGTKEQEPCSCKGIKSDCDFYPEVRVKALLNE